ncbi:MAG: DUF2029 domain-containing protein [Clostridia bacterium]|nr:DUF2029 domain-containing protein [Clostridia bacterium]
MTMEERVSMSPNIPSGKKKGSGMRIALILIAIVAIVTFSFLFTPMVELVLGANPNEFSREPETNLPIEMKSKKVIRQVINVIPNETVEMLSLRFGTYQRKNKGILIIRLCEEDNPVASWRIRTEILNDNEGRGFKLETPYTFKENCEYSVTIVDTYQGTNTVALYIDQKSPVGYYVDDEFRESGCICYWLSYKHSILPTFIGLVIALSAITALFCIILKRHPLPRHAMKPAILFFLICSISFMSVIGVFCFAKGDPWLKYFFRPSDVNYFSYADTGMDFFNSVHYVHTNDPYGQYGTIYPPLANLFFKGIYHLVPEQQKARWTVGGYGSNIFMRRSENDYRAWMPTEFLFLFIFCGVSLLTYIIIVNYDGLRVRGLYALTFILSYAYAYAVERGNIIILSMAAALFFAVSYDSPRRWVRELALLSLAVSANLKLYPALIGILLLYDRRWKEAVRAVIYGVLLFVLPCLAFKNGLKNIPMCLNQIRGFAGLVVANNSGTSFDKIFVSVINVIERCTNTELSKVLYYKTAQISNCVVFLLCIVGGVILKKKWQKVLSCVLGMILLSNQGIYGTVFLILPAVMFFNEEAVFTRDNVGPFVGFVISIACLPVFNKISDSFSFTSLRVQIGLIILLGYVIVAAIRRLNAE